MFDHLSGATVVPPYNVEVHRHIGTLPVVLEIPYDFVAIMAKPIPTIKLSNGAEIPALGFGTFADEIIPGEMHAAVLAALDAGYRHLDCAWYYKNESEVGTALTTWLASNPEVAREDIFITTKVWPHLLAPSDLAYSLESSLEKLGVEYVDAFLLHWPFACERDEKYEVKLNDEGKYILKPDQQTAMKEAWQTMEYLQRSGKAKVIGVSNYTISHLKTLLKDASIKPAINQVEIHPYLPNTELIDFCKSNAIVPVAYSPLGSQGQSTKDRPDLQATVLTDPTLKGIANNKDCSVAAVCIAWGIRRGYIVLPKSSNPARLKANFELVELSDEEFDKVNSIAEGLGKKDGRGVRFVNPIGMFGFDVWAGEEV